MTLSDLAASPWATRWFSETIALGDWVAVGANAVVTHDAEPSAVVAGVPAREISREGAHGYVNNVDYLDYEAWRSRRRR